MSSSKTILAAMLASTATLFAHGAQAMKIWQFDKMAQDDRAEYVSQLISGAEKVLTDEGRADQATQVGYLFQDEWARWPGFNRDG
jgi:hypothetical protein